MVAPQRHFYLDKRELGAVLLVCCQELFCWSGKGFLMPANAEIAAARRFYASERTKDNLPWLRQKSHIHRLAVLVNCERPNAAGGEVARYVDH